MCTKIDIRVGIAFGVLFLSFLLSGCGGGGKENIVKNEQSPPVTNPGGDDSKEEQATVSESDSWKTVSQVGAPSARFGHTAVWTGSEMIIWGGESNNSNATQTDTGGKYDPSTDSWIPTSILNVPQARGNHSAIWTGSHMIVWGGNDITGGKNSGSAYDPFSDTWRAITTNGAPTKRQGHTALWTGSKMIVWGGYDGTRLGTGGIYDPSSDTWSEISTNNAPSGRTGHSMIWTGDKVIIWGGFDGVSESNESGIFDPKSNTWTRITTVGAPSPRTYHSAVWTGDGMLIWGGENDPSSGGRYSPETGTWSAISGNNSPALIRNSALWANDKMLVWGGLNQYDEFKSTNVGFIYNYALNSWAQISTQQAPKARSYYTRVWTGGKMIIWGGFDGTSTTNTGGSYTP